jgi:hypothetical protein
MKKQEQAVRKKMIPFRMNEDEFKMLGKLHKQSTERHISNYMRKVLLQKPVAIIYRNQSADDFLKDMLALKKELNAAGNNFNQAVKKLHLLDKIPEFRVWLTMYDNSRKALLEDIEEIKLRMGQLYEQWLQK